MGPVFLCETHLAQLNCLQTPGVICSPHSPIKGSSPTSPAPLIIVSIDPFFYSTRPVPCRPQPASSKVFPHQWCGAERLRGAAAGAAVTGTVDILNWLPWGSPLGGAEEGTNCRGMLKRTRAHAGLVKNPQKKPLGCVYVPCDSAENWWDINNFTHFNG